MKASEFKMTPGTESGRDRGAARAACLAGPVPGGWPQPGSPGQLPAYKLTVRVIAELYPPLSNERRWGFQNAIASWRGPCLIRAAARWDKLDEATVTIECRARDAAAAEETARAAIRRTAALTGQIGVRDIKVARVAPAGQQALPWTARVPSMGCQAPGALPERTPSPPAAGRNAPPENTSAHRGRSGRPPS